MEIKIFYSWQSDSPNNTNRGFIEKALTRAVKSIRDDDSIKIEPVIDRDTLGVPGSPNIPQVILEKIDGCDIFVCDVSIINHGSEFKPTPNPNVIFELGYALKHLSWNNIVLIMNEAFGSVAKLPFDLEKRRAILYELSENHEGKADIRKVLEKRLEQQIRFIVEKIDHQIEKNPVTEKINKVDLFLQKAEELEEKKEFQAFRGDWFNSGKGLEDVFSSVLNILRLMNGKYEPYIKTYKSLGIELSKQAYFFNLENKEYGCKVALVNFDTASSLSSKPSIFLLLELFKKNIHAGMIYPSDPIRTLCLFPDINSKKEVFWVDSKDHLNIFSPEEICNKCFEWLIDQIQSPLPTIAEQERINREEKEWKNEILSASPNKLRGF